MNCRLCNEEIQALIEVPCIGDRQSKGGKKILKGYNLPYLNGNADYVCVECYAAYKRHYWVDEDFCKINRGDENEN